MEPGRELLFPKRIRRIMRPIIGIVMLFLPLTHYRLSHLKILPVIMGCVMFFVMWESVTNLQCDVKMNH